MFFSSATHFRGKKVKATEEQAREIVGGILSQNRPCHAKGLEQALDMIMGIWNQGEPLKKEANSRILLRSETHKKSERIKKVEQRTRPTPRI